MPQRNTTQTHKMLQRNTTDTHHLMSLYGNISAFADRFSCELLQKKHDRKNGLVIFNTDRGTQ